MAEEIKLKESISKIIKNKLEDATVSEEVKNFLNELLSLELEHLDGTPSWWGYSAEYEKLIKKYTKYEEVEE